MDYQIIRSRRRTLGLEVKQDGSLLVRAPLALPRSRIEAFVAQKADWIEKMQRRQAERRALHPEPTAEERAELLRRAREVLPQRVAAYSAQMGLVPTAVHITSARTRFGSCSSKNSISFSWRLMQYPPEAIDYVVVHELAHIRHHDHSPAFYALVARFLPDWKERQKLLRS